MIATRKRTVKPRRVSPRSTAPFAAGLYAPVPPEPTPDPMPKAVRRWYKLDLTPLVEDDGPCGEPDAVLTVSGSWAMPGEDWSWEVGHNP